jgi:hypothetical protein
MTSSTDPHDISSESSPIYEIRVCGVLDPEWCSLFEGMTLEVVHGDAQPVTVIRMAVQDQAALAGVLDALFGVNAKVLSVNTTQPVA